MGRNRSYHNGQLSFQAAPELRMALVPVINLEALKRDALDWARESGLKEPIEADPAERTEFPVSGHGYFIVIRDGRGRLATARFRSDGTRSLWTVDGHAGV